MAGSADSPMTLTGFMSAVTAGIKGRLPALKVCELHGGRFDVDELRRLGRQAPAVFLSALAVPAVQNPGNGQHQMTLQLTAFIVAKDLTGCPRDSAAMNMTEALLVLLRDQLWGQAGRCGFPRQLSARNLYSGALDKINTALWGVSWKQDVFLGTDIWQGDEPLPREVYAGIEPDTGSGYEERYERL